MKIQEYEPLVKKQERQREEKLAYSRAYYQRYKEERKMNRIEEFIRKKKIRQENKDVILPYKTKEALVDELDGDMGICSAFGCAIKLSMQEALFGSKCIKHC